MKTIPILVCTLFLSLQLSAQVEYPTQPKEGYYENLKAMAMPLVPSKAELINAKAAALPVNFKDTLLKYDWYELASYYVYTKSYVTNFGPDLKERETKYAINEFGFERYSPKGIIYQMKLGRYRDATIKVTTTTFNEKTAQKLVGVKKVGNKTMQVTSIVGETENQEILSYKNGVMIMKIRKSPNSTTKVFIIAYLAVPKGF